MKYFDLLHQLQSRLQNLTGFTHEYLVTDFLCPSKEQNSVVVREGVQGTEVEVSPEVLILIEDRLLSKYEDLLLPGGFELEHFPELSIIVEELSHFNALCDRLSKDEKISQLELEVQGEVDKFALALEVLEEKNRQELNDKVFDVIFDRCRLGDWVPASQKQRYFDAHEIAKNFCRKIMRETQNADERRTAFRDFFSSPRHLKLNP